jgi:hypothetical protein
LEKLIATSPAPGNVTSVRFAGTKPKAKRPQQNRGLLRALIPLVLSPNGYARSET